jgi:hypothetical protein
MPLGRMADALRGALARASPGPARRTASRSCRPGSTSRLPSLQPPGRRLSSAPSLRHKDEYFPLCYCISSWFRLPEQGMDNFELLSRASSFLVRREGQFGVHIVTSAHVVHPFAFPNYYPPDQHAWLRFVNERHVITKFEVRERDGGQILFSTDLHDKVYRHETRDICVLHPEDQAGFAQALAEFEGGTREHILELEDESAVKEWVDGKAGVMFVGHEIIEASGELQEQLPCVVPGSLLGQTPQGQIFASTERTLKMGMCGGPVLAGGGKCIGATEGIVPETGPEPLRLCAAVISAGTVRELLRDIDLA